MPTLWQADTVNGEKGKTDIQLRRVRGLSESGANLFSMRDSPHLDGKARRGLQGLRRSRLELIHSCFVTLRWLPILLR